MCQKKKEWAARLRQILGKTKYEEEVIADYEMFI